MLDRNVSELKGIGPRRAAVLLEELGIETIEDLLYFRPRRYLDRSTIKRIADCFLNEDVTVIGTITGKWIRPARKKFLEVQISDETDSISGIFFGGVNSFSRIFTEGDQICFSGKISFYKTKQMVHPAFDFLDTGSSIQSINTGRIIPLYRSSEKLGGVGMDSRGFRRIIRQIIDSHLEQVPDPFEAEVLLRHDLMRLKDALVSIHFPEQGGDIEKARKRLAFNELFYLHYYIASTKKSLSRPEIKKKRERSLALEKAVIASLPYSLTKDQRKALDDIEKDIFSPFPMNRMLQGDVGSGKTIVCLLAACAAVGNGAQVALMAPTEVLAGQHYRTFTAILADKARVALLTGGTPKADKNRIYGEIAQGTVDIVIGTHALIQESLIFSDLGLIIIDEQHRFGVAQRGQLRAKGYYSDLLVMTATPIPRTLTLTIFGDLDVSTIRQKPENRLPVKTMSLSVSKVEGVYRSLEKYISQGRQVYYVLPLIEESEKIDLKSAIAVYKKLKDDVFPKRRVALLHGRMKQEEKDGIMAGFTAGSIDILVATTVIEVGIDVPNATVIVIEHAERFGLSQLHQLRGRVGRGEHQSFCVLIYPEDVPDDAVRRIETIVQNDDGFIIAEADLRQRGAGEILGVRQHGRNTGFEFTDLSTDYDLIISAKKEALMQIDVGSESGTCMHEGRTKRVLSMLS